MGLRVGSKVVRIKLERTSEKIKQKNERKIW